MSAAPRTGREPDSAPGGVRESAAGRGGLIVAALLLALYATLAWITRTAGVTHSNDDALYMLLGDQVTHLSYREAFKVGAPYHGQYPPVWPAMLAVVQVLSGGSELARFVLVTALFTASLALFFDLSRRLVPQWLALGMLAAAALNPFAINFGGRVMSEAAFLFWTILTIWATQRSERGGRGFTALATIAAIAAALTRSIGLTLVAAIIANLLFRKKWRKALDFGVTAAIVIGGWFAWTLRSHEAIIGRSYVADAALIAPRGANTAEPKTPIATLTTRVVNRVGLHLTDMIPSGLPLPSKPGTIADNVAWLVLVLGLGLAGAVAAATQAPLVVTYVMFYFGLLTVWPWSPRRFFIPVQPLVVLIFVLGALEIGRRTTRRTGLAIAAGFLALVTITSIPQALENAQHGLRCDRVSPWTSDACYGPDQQAFFAAAAFARDSLPKGARFLVEREAAFAYHTGHIVEHAQVFLPLSSEEFLARLSDEAIEYVVLTNLTESEWAHQRKRLREVCRRFELVKTFPPSAHILRLLPKGAPDATSACDELARIRPSEPITG